MNRQFSFWEVTISGVIILVLAFVLVGSLTILYQSNLRISVAEQKASCRSSLEKIVSSEFAKASKVYAVQTDQSEQYLQKIGASESNFAGIAFVSGRELKIFTKQKEGNEISYFYSIYNLESDFDFSDKKLVKDIGKPVNTQDLFAEKCHAAQSATPFSLRTTKQYRSDKQAVLLLMQDEIFSKTSDIGSKLYMRKINEFN